MKLLTKLSTYFFWIGLSLLLSTCKKENTDNSTGSSSTTINRPPIADAGADIVVNRTSCSSPGTIELDGSRSSDSDNNKLLYGWTKISGPSCSLSDTTSPFAHVTNFQAGEYAFELKITDASGLSSKDTVVINVTGTPSPGEVDLDVSLVAEYSFIVNTGLSGDAVIVYAALCQLYGQCPPLPSSEARTSLTKIFDLPSWGQFRFKLDETAEATAATYNHETSIVLMKTNDPSWWASGQCSINFKKLIQAGGGLFNGTCQMSNGSAMRCDQNIFTNLAPLSVSGILDTTTHTVGLTLKGMVYF